MINDNINVPKLRFPEFTKPWTKSRLGDLGSIAMNRRIFKNETSDHGEIPFFKIGTFGKKPDAFISRQLFEEYKEKYPYPEIGDILISASGSIGRTVVYTGNDEYFQDSNIVWLKHDDQLNNKFLKQFYSIVKWKGVEGTTIKRLYNKNILDTTINVPSPLEQKTIGEFLETFDNLITLQQLRIKHLKERKTGLLQKMFPKNGEKVPEIRFPGFTHDWEQRKLSELTTINARIGWQNLRTSEFLDSGDYMLITGTDFKDGGIDYSNIHYIDKERYDQDKKIQIQNNSILITKDGTLGKVAYVERLSMPATLNAGVFNVRVREGTDVDSKYLFHYLKAPFLLKYADAQSTGGTIKHLNQNVLVNFPIPLPIIEEQIKIGTFFKQLDNTITLHQRKLEHLQLQKKGLLQQMFI